MSIKILLAEDNKLIRAGIKTIFDETDGFEPALEAQTGIEAVKKAQEFSPDIILLDLGLPDISGIEVIKQLKEKTPNIKIIVLTAASDGKEIAQCLNLGISAYVLKDISTDMLINITKDVYSGAVRFDSAAAEVLLGRYNYAPAQKNLSRSEFRNNHSNLTRREYEVLKLIVDGKSNNDIAEELCISSHTAKAHVCSIIQKLVVDDRTQAAVKALKEGLVG